MKTALIIGGSEGIGLSLVKEALQNNYKVCVLARKSNANLKNLPVSFIAHDFNETNNAKNIINSIRPHLIVFCVAYGVYGKVDEVSNNEIIKCTRATFESSIIWFKECVNALSKGSRVAWISSLTSKVPNEEWAFYGAGKAGVEHFISSVRDYFLSKDITITTCYPGCVNTSFHCKAGGVVPLSAISPESISKDMFNAILKGLPYWASSMDKSVIDEVYNKERDFFNKFKSQLK